MTAEPDQSKFPPGTRAFAYAIDVEFTNPAISGYRGKVERHQEGTLWLSPGYDFDGVRAHVAARIGPPPGYPEPGTVTRFELAEEPS